MYGRGLSVRIFMFLIPVFIQQSQSDWKQNKYNYLPSGFYSWSQTFWAKTLTVSVFPIILNGENYVL